MSEMCTIYTRVSKAVHEVLSDHAFRCGRSLTEETALWLDLAKGSCALAALQTPNPDTPVEEVERQREVALRFMELTISRALPHGAPEALASLLPTASRN